MFFLSPARVQAGDLTPFQAFWHFYQGQKLLAGAPGGGPVAKLRSELLKNKSAAALRLGLARVALGAANAALGINQKDDKARAAGLRAEGGGVGGWGSGWGGGEVQLFCCLQKVSHNENPTAAAWEFLKEGYLFDFSAFGFLASWLFGFVAFLLLGFWAFRLFVGLCFGFSHPLHSQFLFGRWRFCGFGGFGLSHPLLFLSGLFGFCTLSLVFGFGSPHHQHHQFLPI